MLLSIQPFRPNELGQFQVNIESYELIDEYNSERSIHGDGHSFCAFQLSEEQFLNLQKQVEKNCSAKKYPSKYIHRFLDYVGVDDETKKWNEKFLHVTQGTYYAIDHSPDEQYWASYDLLLLNPTSYKVYFKTSDS